jgi:hypothetical protein
MLLSFQRPSHLFRKVPPSQCGASEGLPAPERTDEYSAESQWQPGIEPVAEVKPTSAPPGRTSPCKRTVLTASLTTAAAP